jgi:hypothetical protein
MPNKQRRYRPTSLLVGVSLCLSAVLATPVPAAAAACQAGDAGCVLPVGGTPPAPAPTVVDRTPVIVDVDEGGGGIGWLPILLGLAALAALYFFVIDDDEEEISP